MIGRFLRWYPGYTAEQVLRMPASQFFALNRAIKELRAEEEVRLLRLLATAANPGERGAQLQAAFSDLQSELGSGARERMSTPVVPYITPGVRSSDGIRDEHERRKASHSKQMR